MRRERTGLTSLLNDLWQTLAGMAWLEFTGLISGLLCVWLLIRQNIWTFPIGLVYSVISVAVFVHERLYADVRTVHSPSMGSALAQWDVVSSREDAVHATLGNRIKALTESADRALGDARQLDL